MKITIQGHPTRGKEVIQILESLGGKNNGLLTGKGGGLYYYIDTDDNNEIRCHDIDYVNSYKKYTLEEFEKEFPFKIGDKVTTTGTKHPKIITGITNTQWGLRYVISEIKFPDSKEMPHISQISLYKEMKEERNITLTFDKAKEWYKKGGELKEVALQAFTEKELNPLPRSWEEFCKRGNPIAYWRYSIPTKYEALYQLEQLRNCWWNGWEPIWDASTKYSIKRSYNEINVIHSCNVSAFLAFSTKEMAEEFLECFRDLIEKAGDLI